MRSGGGWPERATVDAGDRALTSDGALTYTNDAAGNLTDDGINSYVWDWADRLESATIGSTTAEYAYDGDGVRVGATTSSTTTAYTWDRLSGLPLLVDDGEQSYLHAAGGVQAEIDGSDGATYHLSDVLGSTRGLTDASGTLVGTADYSVFGGVRGSAGTTSIFGYSGEQRDSETGFTYLRARELDPRLGRFLSADSVQPNAPGTQGYNRYAYTANNPATWVDPSGHSTASAGELAWSAFAIGVLIAVGEALGRATRAAIPILSSGLVGFAVGLVVLVAWISWMYALINVITQIYMMLTDAFDFIPDGILPDQPPLDLDLDDIANAWKDFPQSPLGECVGKVLLGAAAAALLIAVANAAAGTGGTGGAVRQQAVGQGALGAGLGFCFGTPDGGSEDEDRSEEEGKRLNLEKLSKSDIATLAKCGLDAEQIKNDIVGGSISLFDLYKDKDTGLVYVLRKGGTGEPQPTGINIKELRKMC